MRNRLDPTVLARAEPLAAGQIDCMLLETAFWPLHGDEEHAKHATTALSCDSASPVGAGLSAMSDEPRGLSCHYCRGDAATARLARWLPRTECARLVQPRGARDGRPERTHEGKGRRLRDRNPGRRMATCRNDRTDNATRHNSYRSIIGSMNRRAQSLRLWGHLNTQATSI